jgi:hypothetical protein
MTDRNRGGGRWAAAAYLLLLGVHTAAASALLWVVFPVFQKIVERVGQPQLLDASTEIAAIGAMLVMQGCYWLRYWLVPLWVPFRSAVVGHVLMFASRASFFFGGALFSAIFFRHIPQLDALPPLGQAIAKTLGVAALLFALFCYSLELERLGRSMEERAAKAR